MFVVTFWQARLLVFLAIALCEVKFCRKKIFIFISGNSVGSLGDERKKESKAGTSSKVVLVRAWKSGVYASPPSLWALTVPKFKERVINHVSLLIFFRNANLVYSCLSQLYRKQSLVALASVLAAGSVIPVRPKGGTRRGMLL
jgi:hypothetical protein